MEKCYLVYVGGRLAPYELRNKWGFLIRSRKKKSALLKWAKENGYAVEINDNPVYEK
jgi:hypothetical protein